MPENTNPTRDQEIDAAAFPASPHDLHLGGDKWVADQIDMTPSTIRVRIRPANPL